MTLLDQTVVHIRPDPDIDMPDPKSHIRPTDDQVIALAQWIQLQPSQVMIVTPSLVSLITGCPDDDRRNEAKAFFAVDVLPRTAATWAICVDVTLIGELDIVWHVQDLLQPITEGDH